ncbi:cell division protein FtsQ/DivIB, partial [Streptomyces sp. 12297]
MAVPTTAQRGGTKDAAGPPASPGPRKPRKPKRVSAAARPRGPRSRKVLAVAVLAAAVLLAGGGTWVLYGSSWLRVEKVGITGTGVLTVEQVRTAAAVPVGAPMASVDTDEIAARVRGALPRIDTVDVVRAWPHGIGLKVTERKPVLLVKKGTGYVEVDATGVRFATVAKAPAGVPELRLDAEESPSLRRFGEERLLHEANRTPVASTSTYPVPFLTSRTGLRSVTFRPIPCGQARTTSTVSIRGSAPRTRA